MLVDCAPINQLRMLLLLVVVHLAGASFMAVPHCGHRDSIMIALVVVLVSVDQLLVLAVILVFVHRCLAGCETVRGAAQVVAPVCRIHCNRVGRIVRSYLRVAAEGTPKQVDEAALVLPVEECVQNGIDAAVGGAEPEVRFVGVVGLMSRRKGQRVIGRALVMVLDWNSLTAHAGHVPQM